MDVLLVDKMILLLDLRLVLYLCGNLVASGRLSYGIKLIFVLLRNLDLCLNLRIQLYLLIGGVDILLLLLVNLSGFQSTILFQTCGGSILLLVHLILFETIVEIFI